jgi:dipeptidyl-peptidase-4
VLAHNAAPAAARAKLRQGRRERFRVTTKSGIELDGWALYPPRFDESRRWPVLFHVYGEPWGQTVQDRASLGNELWHLMLTQEGYVVMSLDGRGTPAPRGREWRKCVHGAIGDLAAKDQAEGVEALLRRHRWMDPERIGIWGWSGGGSQTLNALFRYPDVYRAGIAVAAVPDQRLYDTIYQERYMGTPQANPAGYAAGSPITFADGLSSELLLVHGTGDDNVHAQGAWQLVDALVARKKPFEMMFYPSRSHGLSEREGTRAHLYATMTSFLERALPAGARR